MNRSVWRLLGWPFLMVTLTLLMFLFPQATFDGAKYGLETWAFTLVPSLLPFMIVADILIQLGVVNFLGVLLEPLMRPLFRLPGSAGFVVAMGFTSGFPMGALLTDSLYEKKLCTKNEAARLVTFTNNASPLFLLVAIPVSMLHAPEVGWILLAAHYCANLLIGLASRFFAPCQTTGPATTEHLLSRSLQALIQCRQEQALPIGAILGNAVSKGIKNILSIGGFVLFFSVAIQILTTIHIVQLLTQIFAAFLTAISFDTALGNALSSGLFEMTLGTRGAALTAAPLVQKLLLISFILGWSGLSIHAQVGSIISRHGIPLWPYLICRPVQGLLAAGFALFFFQSFSSAHTVWLPLMLPLPLSASAAQFKLLLLLPLVILGLLITFSILLYFLAKLRRLSKYCFKRLRT